MIDIILCYSILEKCGYLDAFYSDSGTIQMVLRLRQHRMVLSEALMDYYDEYFQNKAPQWQEWYRNFCADILYTEERAVMVTPKRNGKLVTENPYYNELVTLSRETADKILLMEPKDKIKKSIIDKWGITVLDSSDIKDDRGSNIFSMYTLPVNGKHIEEGQDSDAIAKWFGRFLITESYLQIFDNYLLTKDGINYLRKYILKYIKDGSEIEIYSKVSESFSEQMVKEEFSKNYYSKWKFTIYNVKSVKYQHARSIQGSRYIIQVERGLSVFGRDGHTFQTIVNIYNNENKSRIILKESQLKQIV
jgi:hypothetical protein